MTTVFTVIEQWLGLCRKAPVLPALQEVRDIPAEFTHENRPDGGSGVPGSIRRGIGSALSGMRILDRNRQLLWFTLLTGLVMAGTTICQGLLCYINWILSDAIALRLVLDFFIEFTTVFCLVFLLAGLYLSISSMNEHSSSFFAGLAAAKKFKGAIFLWSLILALAGVLLERLIFYPGGLLFPFGSYAVSILAEYPFSLHLNPSTFAEIPGYGGRSLLFWTYPYGFENTLEFMVVTLLMFILTAFVVPLIVLERKTVRGAVAGSFALMRKTWAETALCATFLGIIVFGVFLTYLLVQAAHGIATPPNLLYDRPSPPWLAAGILYYLVLLSVAFVAATAGGIAMLEVYRHARTTERAS